MPHLAQDFGSGNLKNVADQAALSTTTSLPVLVGNIIRTFIGLLGIIFLLLAVYAGFLWLTAQGDDKKVTTAKTLLKNAVIGLVIIIASYAIAQFVIGAVVDTAAGKAT